MRTTLAAFSLTLLAFPALSAGPRGQGAVVIHDDAPIYAGSKGDKVEWKLKRGDAVAGYTSGFPPTYLLDEVDGRVHVLYFSGEQKGMSKTAWMDPKDLSRFTYDGSCQSNGSPLAVKGFSQRWNACFEEARDNKLDGLRATWATQDAAAKSASVSAPAPAPAQVPATPEPAAASTSAPPPAPR
jgi:hypothetical protein